MAKSNFPPDFKKKYEQWQKIKDEPAEQKLDRTNKVVIHDKSPTSPSAEKKIRGRPLQQQTIQVITWGFQIRLHSWLEPAL